ncbi:hypothetical protein CL634_03530 [bacterium]|nr:hypothetical protein [bacterium]
MQIKLWPNEPDCSCQECTCDQASFGEKRECDCMECDCETYHEEEEEENNYKYPTAEEEWDTQP